MINLNSIIKISLQFFLITVVIVNLFNTQQAEDFDDDENELKLLSIQDTKCDLDINCRLPFCNCDSPNVPFNYSDLFKLSELPQMVVITIDDDRLDLKSYQVYKKLLEKFKNPNNCSIKATFFISDTTNQTSFCLLRNLYERKHEIAISAVNYSCPNKRCSTDKYFQPWDYSMWSNQILNMRSRLNKYAGIPNAEIVGFRAPILEPAADMHYKIISSNKFVYDSSLVINTDDFVWPFTLSYPISSPLSNNGPVNSYPGLWELPIQTYLDSNNKREFCLKLWEGHCKYERTSSGVFKFLRRHFLRSYYKNRAPVILHLNADWLKEFEKITRNEILPNVGYSKKETTKIPVELKKYYNLDGLINFINETTVKNKDVYFVTAQQAIEWMKILPRLEAEELEIMRQQEISVNKDLSASQREQAKKNIKKIEKRRIIYLKNYLKHEIFDEKTCKEQDFIYDGSCKFLKQVRPDYDMEDNMFDLDDNFEILWQKKLKIEHTNKLNLLSELQSEVLFINNFILIFIISLIVILIIFIVKDKYFS